MLNTNQQKIWIKSNWDSLVKRGKLKEALLKYWSNRKQEDINADKLKTQQTINMAKDIFRK